MSECISPKARHLPVLAKLLLEHTKEFVLYLDKALDIVECSYSVVDYYGWDYEKLMGSNYLDLCQECGVESALPDLLPRLLSGEVITQLETILNVSGVDRYATWRLAAVHEEGAVIGFLLTGVESTHERLLKLQAEQDQVRLASIISCLPGHVYWKNSNGVYLGANDQFAQFVGYRKGAEICGYSDDDFFPAEEAAKLRENDHKVLHSGEMFVDIEHVVDRHGVKVIMKSHKVPHVVSGKLVGILGVSLDITSQQQTEKRLRSALARMEAAEIEAKQTQAYLNNIIAHVPAALFWKNAAGVYLGCNDAFVKLIGAKNRNEIIGTTDARLLHPNHVEMVALTDQKVLSSGKKVEYELAIDFLKAGRKEILGKKSPLYDAQGQIIGVLCLVQDITAQKAFERNLVMKQKRAEKESQDASHYFENILSNFPGALAWKAKDGTYLGCNNYLLEVTGLKDRNRFVGHTDEDMPWADKAKEIRAYEQEVMALRAPLSFELLVDTAEGHLLHVLAYMSPLLDSKGEVIGVISTCIDISARKQIEKELEISKKMAEMANQAKSNFLACISHDFRTPLNAIIGYAQLMQLKRNLSIEKKHLYLVGIQEAGKRLLSFIDRVLEFSQLEMVSLQKSDHQFALDARIQKTLDMVTASLSIEKRQQIVLTIDMGVGVNQDVVGDEESLARILSNLLSNAYRFTEKGKIQFSAEITPLNAKTLLLECRIQDTGVGIPADKLDFIFGRFSRVTPSYKGGSGGVGLGLAICKQLLNELGGEIGVDSEEGVGSTFWFSLPFKSVKKIDTVRNALLE